MTLSQECDRDHCTWWTAMLRHGIKTNGWSHKNVKKSRSGKLFKSIDFKSSVSRLWSSISFWYNTKQRAVGRRKHGKAKLTCWAVGLRGWTPILGGNIFFWECSRTNTIHHPLYSGTTGVPTMISECGTKAKPSDSPKLHVFRQMSRYFWRVHSKNIQKV
jgi:hypothetical protein